MSMDKEARQAVIFSVQQVFMEGSAQCAPVQAGVLNQIGQTSD